MYLLFGEESSLVRFLEPYLQCSCQMRAGVVVQAIVRNQQYSLARTRRLLGFNFLCPYSGWVQFEGVLWAAFLVQFSSKS